MWLLQSPIKALWLQATQSAALLAVWCSGNSVGHINKVNLHRAGLELVWMIVCRCTILAYNWVHVQFSLLPSAGWKLSAVQSALELWF